MTSTFGCPHCGKTNPIDAPFCWSCGTDLRQVDADALARRRTAEEEMGENPPAAEQGSSGAEERSGGRAEEQREEGARGSEGIQADEPRSLPFDEPRADLSTSLPLPQLSGLLEPVEPSMDVERPDAASHLRLSLDDETRRQLRQMFATEVPLSDAPPPAQRHIEGSGLRRRAWIYWLLLGVLLLALLIDDDPADVLPHVWPGVSPAHAVIEALPEGAIVLVDWAYDPATAGEMDLVARPVIEHLLAQDADLVVVSQLPLGPATARRLISAAGAFRPGEVAPRNLDAVLTEGGFLPGGAATLPLLGQAPSVGVPVDLQGRSARSLPALAALEEEPPALAVVIAARSEPVQRWLEQVQPLNGVSTVAVTSAAVGPVLRPYLDSGQLVGLVSGYSGGIGYRGLLLRPWEREEQRTIWRQIRGHDWALIVLLVVVLAGNLALPAERRQRDAVQ